MASERGGYRRPSEQQTISGIGKNSRRTDRQAIKSPNVQDSTDLQVGDRERIRQGQKVQSLSRTPPPRVSAPPRGSPSPAGGGAGSLPDFLTEMPTNRPDEPLTSGMDMGPGSGSDILGVPPPSDDPRVIALERYAREFNNPTAQRYLDRIYRPQPTPETVAPAQVPTMTETEVPMEDDFADEEESAVEETEETTPAEPLA